MQHATMRLTRRQFACGCCAGAAVAWVPAIASATDQFVPVALEPRHHKRFENEYLRVLEVIIEPRDTTLFHEHRRDLALVPIQATEVKNEVLGKPEAVIVKVPIGVIRFSKYEGQPYVHRVTNLGSEPFVLIAFEIVLSGSGQFTTSDRNATSGYVAELENDRVRGWRLKLEPGQSAAPIMQAGPGLRVLLSGDAFSETVHDAEHGRQVKRGDFEWLPPGTMRSLRNTGTKPLELVEWELR
jgi:quercetin dioxygenase-like cupin family protein